MTKKGRRFHGERLTEEEIEADMLRKNPLKNESGLLGQSGL